MDRHYQCNCCNSVIHEDDWHIAGGCPYCGDRLRNCFACGEQFDTKYEEKLYKKDVCFKCRKIYEKIDEVVRPKEKDFWSDW